MDANARAIENAGEKSPDSRSVSRLVLKQQQKRMAVLADELEKHRAMLEATSEGLVQRLKQIESAKVYTYNEAAAKQRRNHIINMGALAISTVALIGGAIYGVQQFGLPSFGGAVKTGAAQFASVIGSLEDKATFEVSQVKLVQSEGEETAEVWVSRQEIGTTGGDSQAEVVQPAERLTSRVDEQPLPTSPDSTTPTAPQSESWEIASRSSSSPVEFELVGKLSTKLSAAPPAKKPVAQSKPVAPKPAIVAKAPKVEPAGPAKNSSDNIENFEANFRVVGSGASPNTVAARAPREKPLGVFKSGDFIAGTSERVLAVNPDGGLVTELRVIGKVEAQKLRAK